MVIDFFEWKYNHKLVVVTHSYDRLQDFLEMEMAEMLTVNNNRLFLASLDVDPKGE